MNTINLSKTILLPLIEKQVKKDLSKQRVKVLNIRWTADGLDVDIEDASKTSKK